jgi:hypothetical protein
MEEVGKDKEREREEGVGEERRESNFSISNPRERKGKYYEDIWPQNQLNTPLMRNYQNALCLKRVKDDSET